MLLRMEDKIDKLDARLDSIDVTLAKQHEQLSIHIKRSDLLEQQVEPLKTHVATVSGALKLLGSLALISGIAECVIQILSYVKGTK